MSVRVIGWFGAGAASAVACKMLLRNDPAAIIAYCETGSEDEDNARFIEDCVRWFNAPIVRLRSAEYSSTWEVFKKRRYLSGVNGAPCTSELKVAPRLDFQHPSDVHVFGYTADYSDVARADRFRENYPELKVRFPLIEAGLTKAACLAMVINAGIEPPAVYAMGYPNANCIPCVKATSPNYWALVRKMHPEQFWRMVYWSRQFGARLARINDERVFIDEIPANWPTTNPIAPACDFLCHIAEQDIAA